MSTSKPYQPTPEQLEKWKRLEELEQTAVSGRPISEELQEQYVKEVLDPNYLQNQLDKLRIHKQKLLNKLAFLEDHEELLVEEIQRRAEMRKAKQS